MLGRMRALVWAAWAAYLGACCVGLWWLIGERYWWAAAVLSLLMAMVAFRPPRHQR